MINSYILSGKIAFRLALISAAVLVASARLGAQAEPPQQAGDPGFVIRTESTLVLVPFHVVRKKQYVEGLGAQDIQLLEDGAEQRLAIFEGPGVEG